MKVKFERKEPGIPMKIVRQMWKWSLVVTLPVAIFIMVWAIGTLDRYSMAGVRFHRQPRGTLLNIGQMEFNHLLQEIKMWMTPDFVQEDIPLKTIDLFLSENDLNALNSYLPYSSLEKYVNGQILADGELNKVKVRYRGDSYYHWFYYKKSFRIKTKKRKLYKGMRRVNLINPRSPEQLNNHLSNRLAELFGLIAPYTVMVNLRINGEADGIRVLTEQLDEGTLRRGGHMPGDLYSGELVGADRYTGISNNMWRYPRTWTKSAVNNHYPEESLGPLIRFIELMRGARNDKGSAELWQMMDHKMWGRFSILHTLIQSFRGDAQHNWKLYYDPWKQVMEPVVWDRVGWHGSTEDGIPGYDKPHMDMITDEFRDVLFRNYQFLLSRQRVAEEFFESGLDETFLKEVDETIQDMRLAVEEDPNIVEEYHHISPKKAKQEMDHLRRQIRASFQAARYTFLAKNGKVSYAVGPERKLLKLTVDGRRPVRRLKMTFSEPIRPNNSSFFVRYFMNGQQRDVDVSGAFVTSNRDLDIEVPFMARNVISINPKINPRYFKSWQKYLKIMPAYYEIYGEGFLLDSLVSVSFDQGDGLFQQAEQAPDLEKLEFSDAYYVVAPHPVKKPEIWKGDLVFEGIETIDDDVYIRAGSKIHLKEGASVIIKGKLMAEGTKEKPILFTGPPEGPGPWGVIGLKGKGANGSVLNYCEFSGGSGLKRDLYEYSAMFSIHDVKGVQVKNCLFQDSRVVDDMVHAVYSEIRFENCIFEGAPFDAVDLDICTAVVEDCSFLDNGNDSLDLMTSDVVVKDTLFQNSGDKGISVGEGSNLLAVNVKFTENKIGVQAKDSSQCTLYNAEFINNMVAVDAYKKNWRYGGGGTVRLYKGHLYDNDSNFTADKKSKISIYDSFVDGEIKDKKRIVVDPTVDSKSSRKARVNTRWLYPEDREPAKALFAPYWAAVRPSIRGFYDSE